MKDEVSAQVQAGWQNADLLAGSSLAALFTDGRKLVVCLLVAYVMGLVSMTHPLPRAVPWLKMPANRARCTASDTG